MANKTRIKQEVVGRWDLLTGIDSFSSQTAQSALTSRRLLSWIPEDDGAIHRERAQPKFLNSILSGPVVGLYQFNFNNNGVIQRFQFAAARSDSSPGTRTCRFYVNNGSAWSIIIALLPLADAPMCKQLGNLFHLTDGVTNWIFDGTNWVQEGFRIPLPQVPAGLSSSSFSIKAIGPATAPFTITASPSGTQQGGTNIAAVFPAGAVLAANISGGDRIKIAGVAIPQYNGVWPITGITVVGPNATEIDYETATTGLAVSGNGTGDFATALVETPAAHGFALGQLVSITGVSDPLYNGVWVISKIPSSVRFVVRTDTFGLSAASGGVVSSVTSSPGLCGPVVHAGGGTLDFSNLGRYYWRTCADETSPRIHESSTSAISNVLRGPTVRGEVYFIGNLWTCTIGSANVTVTFDSIAPSALSSSWAGLTLYINGQQIGVILSAPDALPSGTPQTIVLTDPSFVAVSGGRAVVCDARTTHWHLYASESDGSKIGQFLASIPVTQNLSTTPYIDTSPFISDPTNTFLPIFRPVRNDPAPASKLLEVHKYRLWRRRESKPNFFDFSANEEVASGNNGAPWESVPGADVNTLSDIVNEVSFPDQSTSIRGIISHSDALYMFSEKQAFPLYGQSIDDFTILQVTAFNRGIAGRFAGKSTPHGLPFISYDRKALLYPSASTPTANSSDLLVDFGKPMQNILGQIDPARLDEVVTEFYYFGRRNWFILGFPDVDDVWSTYVYDFSTRGWWQSQRGMSSFAVFETADGSLILVGGSRDGYVYVIDDQSGTYVSASDYPFAGWRLPLIDFGAPQAQHVFQYIELEFSDPRLADYITVNFWLDPLNVDDPGEPRTITLQPIKIGSNRFRGWAQGGTTCHRLLIEIIAAVSPSTLGTGSTGTGFGEGGYGEGGYGGSTVPLNPVVTIRGAKLVAKPYGGLTK